MVKFTREEKERIFVGRTQAFYPETWKEYVELVSHEKWTREAMQAYNFAERCRILKYAYENSPFYKRHYDSLGFRPEDVKTEADWDQVPIITKDILREHGAEMLIERERAHLYPGHTGGSTGVPCVTYGDIRSATPRRWRILGWSSGRAIGEVYPTPRETLGQDMIRIIRMDEIHRKMDKKEDALRYPKRMIGFDCQLVQETILHHMEVLTQMEPDSYTLRGYLGSVYQLANYALEHRIAIPRAIAVSVGSSVLTENMRHVISSVFGCPVTDMYGSCEIGLIAHEHQLNTEGRGIHYVFSDLLAVDLVDDAGHPVPDGEVGLTVVTLFTNHVAPVIRYNQGDRTHRVTTPDPLGMPFDRIGPIQGRETDWIIGKDGSKLFAFSGVFHDCPTCVRAFQYRQKEAGTVRLLVVPNKGNPNADAEIQHCFEAFQKPLVGKLDVTLEKVDHIPDDAGKLRCFVREK